MAAKKPTGFKVVGPLAVIRKEKHERYVYRGGVIPVDEIDEDNAKHLQEVGLIEPFDLPAVAE